MKNSVVFRLDAGSHIGLGHLKRCLVLAEEMKTRNWPVHFFIGTDDANTLAVWLKDISFELVESKSFQSQDSENDDANIIIQKLKTLKFKPNWFVIDHYNLQQKWELMMTEEGFSVLALDDFRHRHHHARLLVSDNAEKFKENLNTHPEGTTLTGSQYSLVSKDFKPSDDENYERILITYGGYDCSGMTIRALNAIDLLINHSDFQISGIDVIISNSNPNFEKIFKISENKEKINLHLSPKSLAPFMHNAGLVLCAGGNTLVEALTSKRMCIVTVVAENQRLTVEDSLKNGFIKHAFFNTNFTHLELAAQIKLAWQERLHFSQKISIFSPYDAYGAKRICDEIELISLQNKPDTNLINAS